MAIRNSKAPNIKQQQMRISGSYLLKNALLFGSVSVGLAFLPPVRHKIRDKKLRVSFLMLLHFAVFYGIGFLHLWCGIRF